MLCRKNKILSLVILLLQPALGAADKAASTAGPNIPYSLELRTKEPLAYSVGYVFSGNGQGPSEFDLRREVHLSLPSGDDFQKATLQLRADDFREGNLLMVFTGGSESLIFAHPIREVSPTPAKRNVEPHCPTSEVLRDAEFSISPAKKKLEQLVKMRKARLKLANHRLRELLNGANLHKLNEAEKARGLSYSLPLSAATPISEIVARMVAIEAIPARH